MFMIQWLLLGFCHLQLNLQNLLKVKSEQRCCEPIQPKEFIKIYKTQMGYEITENNETN